MNLTWQQGQDLLNALRCMQNGKFNTVREQDFTVLRALVKSAITLDNVAEFKDIVGRVLELRSGIIYADWDDLTHSLYFYTDGNIPKKIIEYNHPTIRALIITSAKYRTGTYTPIWDHGTYTADKLKEEEHEK